jgi:integrase
VARCGLAGLRRGREANPQKVSGQTRTEVKDKLKALHSELDAGVRTAAGYTVDMAVTDWLAEGLPGRAAKTVEVYTDALRPGACGHRADPTARSDRAGRAGCAGEDGGHPFHADAAEGAQLPHPGPAPRRRQRPGPPKRLALVDTTPHGRAGRPSQALTLEQAAALLEAAEDSRLHAYIVLCLLTGVRSEEARALTWDHVDLDAGTISVWRSVRAHGDGQRRVTGHFLA